jgi:histidine triad (HIT) family protein
MEGCHFCDIAGGRLSTAVVFEDALTFAFLDKHPINRGHTLVIPKEHQPDFYDLRDDSYHALMSTVKRLAKIVHVKLQPKKVGLIVAGWDVAHTHVHIVPMHAYHDVTSKSLLEGTRANPSDEELSKTMTLLRSV